MLSHRLICWDPRQRNKELACRAGRLSCVLAIVLNDKLVPVALVIAVVQLVNSFRMTIRTYR